MIMPVLNKADPGDTVVVHGGEYSESLVIDKSITLVGKNRPWIRGGYTGHVILVSAPGTTIEGFEISEAGTRLSKDFACIRVEADSVKIRNNVISEPLHGIYVKAGSHITIVDNVVKGRLDLIRSDRGNGIHLWNSRHNLIRGNEIFNVRDGIYFSFADSTTILRNHIHHVRYGLHYMYSNANTFTENLFERNVAGAALMFSKHIVFDRNVFARCRGFRAYGILYKSMDETHAMNNLIIDNSRGLFMDNSNFNTFENNDVVDNDLALQILGNGEGNAITNNNFINNLSNLLMGGKGTGTIWASEANGNYWSDYRGYDLDGNGLGDVPHKIQDVFQVIETQVPEVRFYRFSPAAEILEVAERTLPILELGTENDPIPLFRPQTNDDVPWARAAEIASVSSPAAGLIFFVIALLPFSLLIFSNWRRGRVHVR